MGSVPQGDLNLWSLECFGWQEGCAGRGSREQPQTQAPRARGRFCSLLLLSPGLTRHRGPSQALGSAAGSPGLRPGGRKGLRGWGAQGGGEHLRAHSGETAAKASGCFLADFSVSRLTGEAWPGSVPLAHSTVHTSSQQSRAPRLCLPIARLTEDSRPSLCFETLGTSACARKGTRSKTPPSSAPGPTGSSLPGPRGIRWSSPWTATAGGYL